MSSSFPNLGDVSTPILIVDDNVQYSQVLTKILKVGLGFSNVTSVESPQAAFSLIQKTPEHFGVLFVDYNFPSGETGGEFLERLQQNNLLEKKVAFLITSEPTVDNMKQALSAGARGVVAKPFDREKIREQLEKARRAIETENMESF